MTGKREKLASRKKEDEAYGLSDWKKLPIGSALRRIAEQLDKNKGIIRVDNEASYDGKGIDLKGLISCLHILADPTHRENRWACLVEMVKYDDDIYLRLVPSIPLAVKEKWEATGKPPRHMVSNDVGFILETLKQALPSKPAAKTPPARKARKAPRKPSAKKPEPVVELTPKQQQIAFAKNTSAIILAGITAKAKKR